MKSKAKILINRINSLTEGVDSLLQVLDLQEVSPKDYKTIKSAVDTFLNELRSDPDDKIEFYKKYRPLYDKCGELLKKVRPTGYGRLNDFMLIKIKELLYLVVNKFPIGWKRG